MKMKKELELKDFLATLTHNKDYKKIKSQISKIEGFLNDCLQMKITLGESSIAEARKTQQKLQSERNLR